VAIDVPAMETTSQARKSWKFRLRSGPGGHLIRAILPGRGPGWLPRFRPAAAARPGRCIPAG
jgi:hypothetical protein